MRVSGGVGRVVGWAAAPAFGGISFARRARTFHPRGVTYVGSVTPHPRAPAELGDLAARLRGGALVRFSGALWKHARFLPDVLGCAIRFERAGRATAEPHRGDQDLLLATIRRPWTMALAPFTTNVRDFLANDYWAVSPFDAGLRGRTYFRVHPEHRARGRGDRRERLEAAVDSGRARLVLRASRTPWGPWRPLAVIALERRADVDDDALRFRPFRAGRGIMPRGFVHGLRRGVYAVSQAARPRRRR